MSYRIPIGPYHPALEEPYKLDLVCEGETVKEAVVKQVSHASDVAKNVTRSLKHSSKPANRK